MKTPPSKAEFQSAMDRVFRHILRGEPLVGDTYRNCIDEVLAERKKWEVDLFSPAGLRGLFVPRLRRK
jgi:hypothetical protein